MVARISSHMADAIAAYEVILPIDGRRQYMLHPGQLRISHGRLSAEIPLRELSPDYVLARKLTPYFRTFIGMFIFASLWLWYLLKDSNDFLSTWDPGKGFWPGLALSMIVGSLFAAIITCRRPLYAIFRGERARVYIACSGPQANEFRTFVERLAEQIRFVARS